MLKTGLFFKTEFFLEFQLIEAIFRSIEIGSKYLGELLSVLIDRT